MPETPAQRAARERNLSKGNPSAYKRKPAQGAEPPAEPPAEPAPADDTFRARPRAPKKAPRAKAPRKKPAAAPASSPPPAPSGDGGFWQGLKDAFG